MKPAPSSQPRIEIPLILLLITAVLAPIYGGYVVNDATTLAHGFGAGLQEAFGGSDAPVLQHFLIAAPLLLAVILAIVGRRVQQTPKQNFTLIWLVFFLFLGFAGFFSSYRALSVEMWLEWACYGCAMFGAVAICGRRLGVNLLSSAITLGCFVVAIRAILEYGEQRSVDASWRVFGGWINPNATAAILLIGIFLALGICLSQSRTASLFSGLAASFMVVAVVLTGSKGAVSLAMPLGILGLGISQIKSRKAIVPAFGLGFLLALVIGVLFVKNVGWAGLIASVVFSGILVGVVNRNQIAAARMVGVVLVAGGFLALLAITTPVPKAPPGAAPSAVAAATPMSRVSQGSTTQEQSSDFRLNLWKSALYLIKERPVQGFGLGSYRLESGRAGLTTSTMLSHNVYLQIWTETGILPFFVFIGGVGYWFVLVGRSRGQLPDGQLAMLSGTVAAILAVLVHALVDSDLYYFGIGIAFFLVIGLGLSLAGDAVAPELIQKPVRAIAVGASVCIGALLFVFALLDMQKAVVRQDLAAQDAASIKEDTDALGWATSFDGEAVYLQALSDPSDKMTEELSEAYGMFPEPKVGRLLARELSKAGKWSQALDAINTDLARDPRNFRTLTLKMQIELQADKLDEAIQTAKDIVAIEATPYFKVRSIPESIPTETYDARIKVLAPNTKDPKEKAEYLADAVRGYLSYGKTTYAIIKLKSTPDGPPLPGYDSLKEGRDKLQTAIDSADEAAKIYKSLGDSAHSAEMVSDAAVLRADLGS